MTVPVVNAAVAYDCEVTGQTFVLVICNTLYFQNMEENLIPPFMMRLAGVTAVDKCPKFLSKQPAERNHSMFFPDFDIRIPFQLEGIISYLPNQDTNRNIIGSGVRILPSTYPKHANLGPTH